ncbi:katanin p60 ATPase-containing subunit A-like 2 [Genypterus blacodes]|uniref:katanin p60 ATPase-containing subunit A-like 2 n=1 Tax=Genypterus blacodes TaxID=154954 RepID=UPI003F759963
MELSYQSMKIANQVREADQLRVEMRKKSLLILIYHHLLGQGYVAAAQALDQETNGGVRKFEVCDNIDLEMVLMEYESYHHIKFGRFPKLIRRNAEPGESRDGRSGGRKRTPCSAVKPLPKIRPSASATKKAEAKAPGREVKSAGENNSSVPPETADFGLKVSAVGGISRKPSDCRAPIPDSNKAGGVDSDYEERLLKPLSGFPGFNDEMRELAAIISKDIYLHSPNVRWEDIIGLEDAKRLVKEAVVYPIKCPEVFKGIRSPWKGLLLYGPPGTGKTLLAKAVATECKTTFFNISASSIVSKWRGDSEKLVRVLFELVRYHAPSTVFLDEVDWVMGQRGAGGAGGDHEASRRMKSELLVQMDGLAESNDLVFVLAASNLPWELDRAMLRRLEKRVLVGLPCSPARRAMIAHWLPPGDAELLAELDYDTLAKETEGYSGSDIRLVCKEAAMRPARKIFNAFETPQDENSELPNISLDAVTTEDFLDVITHTKPSARNLMNRYAAWEKEYASV